MKQMSCLIQKKNCTLISYRRKADSIKITKSMTLRSIQTTESFVPSSPRGSYNKPMVRIYNLNQKPPLPALSPRPSNKLNLSLALAGIDNSLDSTVLIALSPRGSINTTNHSSFYQSQTIKNLNESGEFSNPYYPCQKLTDEKIDEIKSMLKMKYNRNNNKQNELSIKISVLDDQAVDSSISMLLKRLSEIRPSYTFNPLPANNINIQSTVRFEDRSTRQYLSPRSPKFPRVDQSPRKPKGKLRISYSTLEDVHIDTKIDKDGNDEYDLKIIDLKRRLNEIAKLIKERNSKVKQ